MAKPQEVDPVKLFVAVLWADAGVLQNAVKRMEAIWGKIDFVGPDHLFNSTDYYRPEMGSNLNRRLMSFEGLVPPEQLSNAKHISNEIEAMLAMDSKRSVNLDVGYLDHNKIVLASFKGAGQKIYLSNGVWADLIARYRSGRYQPFDWTFPDFKDGRYDSELSKIRDIYKKQVLNLRLLGK
jgi:hypothetical protein